MRRAGGARGLVGLVLLVLVLSAAGRAGAVPAQTTGERIAEYVSDITVADDGTVTIDEKVTYDFGSNQKHGIFRYIPTAYSYDDVKKGYDRVTPLTVESVTADAGASAKYSRSTSGRNQVLKIGDADKTITGVHTYEIRYSLRGVLNHFDDHDELYLNITGNGWPVAIDRTMASVQVPGSVGRIACFAGPEQSALPCADATKDGSTARFSQGRLGVGDGLTVVVGFPIGTITPVPAPILEQRWSVGTAFAARPDTLVPMGGMAALLVGGFAFMLSKVGRDERFAGGATDQSFGSIDGAVERAPIRDSDPIPVEFVPPDGIRPGQVGTLIDETANTLDVTATIIDLAVRKYLRITEIPKQGWLGSPDWQLDTLRPGNDLKPYEATLLTALFKDGPSVKLSELKNQFAAHLKSVENLLYDDLMANGWYRKRPDHTRTQFGCLAVVVIVAGLALTAGLAASSSYGLVGLPVVLLGLLLIFSNKVFPARTAKGHATLRRVKGFQQFIEESEKDRAKFAEQQNLFSEYLPYAIVFGAVDKWAKAFAGIDGQLPQTDWYVSNHMFTAVLFSQAMTGFTTTTSGTISSVPASSGSSGFGGGGFSGGGMGGGGGGSW